MARSFTDTGTVTSWVGKAVGVVTAVPVTIAAWVNATNFTEFPLIIQLDDGTNSNTAGLAFNLNGGLGAGTTAGGTNVNTTSSTNASAGVWNHVAGVFASTTSRSAYLNGGSKTTNTTSNSPAAFTRSSIGSDHVIGDGFTGSIAFVGIWNIALSDADIAVLAAGVHPSRVHPAALVACVNLIGVSPEPDLVSPTGWTLGGTGTSAVAVNPRQFLPGSRAQFTQRFFNAAGTATLTAQNTGALLVTRPMTGTAAPSASSSGALNVTRSIAGTAQPRVLATGVLGVGLSSSRTLRVSATGAITVPTSAISFSGICHPSMVSSGSITVSRTIAGIASAQVAASGALTVISSRAMAGFAVLTMVGKGAITVIPLSPVVIVSVSGYYICLDNSNAYITMNLAANRDYSWLLQEVISGPYATYWQAIQIQVALGEPTV